MLEREDKKEKIIKYAIYILGIVIIFTLIFLIKGCGTSYTNIESKVEMAAKNYVSTNNINISGETFIELTKLGEIEGTELCKKTSGVIVKNNNGSLEYQAYLDCNEYTSSIVDNNEKYIVLNGENVIVLNIGEAFNDPLYTLKKDCDVQKAGYVGTSPGIYTLTYNAYVNGKLKEIAIRKIIVTTTDKTGNISGLENTEYPKITLKGDRNMTISLGSKYVEPGYTAVDYVDGKISRNVTKNEINTNSVGIYTITYKVVNSRGNSALAVRIVNVVKETSNLNININVEENGISKNVKINLTVTGDGFDYVMLPDGSKNSFRSISYLATQNQIYTFKIYDANGNVYVKEAEVTNIDNIVPVGSCNAKVSQTSTEVTVAATDNKGISGYNYKINGVSTDYIINNTYSTSVLASNVSVEVKDIVGNTLSINCPIEVIKPPVVVPDEGDDGNYEEPIVVSSNLTKEKYGSLKYLLYVPEIAETSSLPLIVYLHGDGEKGNDLNDTMGVSIPKYLKQGKNFSAIIIAPQIQSGTNWYNQSIESALKDLIDYVASNQNVDTSKIILTGHSSGAIGTWHMAARYQNYFSCIVPLSYGDTKSREATSLASSLTNIPIKGYVGANDGSRERMQELVDAINSQGGSAELNVLPGYGHVIQDKVYLNTNIFDWMYSQ